MSEQTYRPTAFTGMLPYFYVGKIYRDDGATDTEEEDRSAGGGGILRDKAGEDKQERDTRCGCDSAKCRCTVL